MDDDALILHYIDRELFLIHPFLKTPFYKFQRMRNGGFHGHNHIIQIVWIYYYQTTHE